MSRGRRNGRPRIAFFDYPDVFEDFYPHYGVDREAFAAQWAATANHALAALLQREVGDVTWYERTMASETAALSRHASGFCVRFIRSSALHRWLWRSFYLSSSAWRRQQWYGTFARLATYTAPLSFRMARALVNDRPDAYFVQDYANGLFDLLAVVARLTRRPLIAYHSGSFPSGYLARWPKRRTIRLASALLVPGREERRRLVTEHGVDPGRIHRVMTPIDTRTFAPMARASAAATAGLDPGRRAVLFVGRLDPVKRVPSIVRAFASVAPDHADVDLVIAGDGPERDRLHREAERLVPDRVKFVGWVADDRVKTALYNAADVLVLASASEGFPTVVGEALACGTPVLATNIGAIDELVRPRHTGWLVPPADDAALAHQLGRILTDPPGDEMRTEARRVAEAEVSPAAIGWQLRSLFDGLLRS